MRREEGGWRVESEVERRHRSDGRTETPWLTLHATALLKEVSVNVSRRALEEEELPRRDPPCSRERRGVGDGHATGGPALSPSLPPAPAWPQGT